MFGERIKELRKRLKLSQADFGTKIGLSQNYIWMIEKGDRTPSDRTIADICRVYNVSEVWLRSGEGEMFEELDPDEELMRFVGTITKDDSHPLNRLARILAHLPPDGIDLISRTVEYLLDREKRRLTRREKDDKI